MRVDQTQAQSTRRQLKSRQTRWAQGAAKPLAQSGVSPNVISVIGLLNALAAGVALWGTCRIADWRWKIVLFAVAIAGNQIRLLCNLFDGMVAMLSDKASPSGAIFNDLPDRFSDLFIFVGAGYAANGAAGPTLGWTAAVLAILTAYVRVLGKTCGTSMLFLGPMAKQHRAAVLTIGCLLAAIASPFGYEAAVMFWALIMICVGCVVTIIRRLRRVCRELAELQSSLPG